MKKPVKAVLSYLLIFIIVASAFAFNVSAASATISGTGEYEVGESFNVTIRFSADATLYAVEADVSYNSSVLRLNSVSGADSNVGNGSVKIVDDGFSATKPSKTSSYTLNFTAIAAGNSNISASLLGGGEAESKASASAAVTVVTPKPSSNANLSSIKLSSGSLSPVFNPNTTNYSATVKYGVENITITGAVADGGATYVGGGTFALEVGDNSRTLTVTAADGTKKSYTINIKRMTEQETLDAEQAARDANPLLVVINNNDYTIVNEIDDANVPTGFTKATTTRKEQEITVLNDAKGKYQLCWLVDQNGENGAFYKRDESDNFTKLLYFYVNNVMYIVEPFDNNIIVPSTYKQIKHTLDGIEVEAIVYQNEKLADFYIFNCYVPGSETASLYRYDVVEGTMQRAIDFDVALQQADAPVEEQPQKTNGKFAWFTGMTTTGKAVFLLIVLIAIILIVVAVLIIVKISSPKEDFDDDFVPIENNDFILNDFSNNKDDTTSEE